MIALLLLIFARKLLRFITDSATKGWTYIFPEGRISEEEDIELGDLYVKEIIENLIGERGNELHPFVIDENIYTIVSIPILADAVHLGTYIEGLKSLHSADIRGISRKDGQLSINASFGAGPLQLRSLATVRLGHIARLLDMKISLDYCKVHVNFSIDPRTGRKGSLQSLCIDEFRGVGFSITGLGLWLYLPNLIMTVLMNFFKGFVKNIVEFELEQHVGAMLQNYQFPIEGKKLEDILISLDSSADELEQLSDVSTEFDVESFKRSLSFVSEKVSPKHIKLRKPMWYTNLPLFEDTIEERDASNDEYEDSDLNIQFQFSKDRVVKEDIEPLTRSERPICYVFLRGSILSEEPQLCNETSESLKSDNAKVSRYANLKDLKLRLNSQSEVQFSKCSPDKHSPDFSGLLTSPEVSIGSNLSECEGRTTPCNLEATDGEIEKLFSSFLVDYPKFVALTSHCEEMTEIDDSNENCTIKIPTDSNKVNSTCNDEKESAHTEVDSQNETNEIEKSTPMDKAGEFREAKYLKLCELKTAYVEKTGGDHNDNLKLGNSSAIHKTSCFKEESKQMEHVESILKWDQEHLEEMDALKSENIGVTRPRNSLKPPQSFKNYPERKTLEPIVKTDECRNVVKTVASLNILSGSRGENNNEIESFVKFGIRPEIEQLDDTVDSVFRCFDHVNMNIFDNLETAFNRAVLIQDGLTRKNEVGVNERRHIEETNEIASCSLEPFSIENIAYRTLNIASETPISTPEITSMKRIAQINEIKREDAMLDNALMSTSAESETVLNDIIDDDDFHLSWVSDADSSELNTDISSDSDMEEVGMEEPKLCKDFKYTSNCIEDETKLVETAIGVENMERSSPVRIMETLVSEDSSALNTETMNLVKDSLINSNKGTIPKTPIDTDDVDVETDVNLKTDIDVPVNINEESIASDNYGLIECSVDSHVLVNAQGTESGTVSVNDYEVYDIGMHETNIKTELVDYKSDPEEPAYLHSLIYGSSVPHSNVNQDSSEKDELDFRNNFELEVDKAVATSDAVQTIASLPECLNSETAFNCPDSEFELKDRDNVAWFDESIQNKLLQ